VNAYVKFYNVSPIPHSHIYVPAGTDYELPEDDGIESKHVAAM